jgi:Cu2+-exporting ATPase
MGKIAPIPDVDAGCPSGLQEIPVADQDPLAGQLDLSSFVQNREDGSQQLDLIIQGAHCASCLAKIENGVGALPDITQARMNLSTMRLMVNWRGDTASPQLIIDTLSKLGYGAAPFETSAAQSLKQSETKHLLKAMAVAGFASMNVMLISIGVWLGGVEMGSSTHTILHWVSAMIALPAVAYAGQPFFKSAWAVLKNRHTNMDVPISLAVLLACGLSIYETINRHPDTYFDAAVMLLFLLLIGRYLDARLRLRTGEAAQRLAAMQTTTATRIRDDGQLETVPASTIKAGERLLIPVGQRIPVDAEIEKGRSEIDMKIATGETLPELRGPGDTVYSGMINLTVPLTVRAIAIHADSFLSEITKLVEVGEQRKGTFVRIADKAAKLYVPVVHSLAFLTFTGWLLIGADLRPAALNAIAVLIITCPCALGLAVPAVQIVASGRLFKSGVLIKSGDALERLAKIKHVVFDKTGTLTLGKFDLVNVKNIPKQKLQIAAAIARYSRHPISKALSKYTGDITVDDIEEIPGKGLTGFWNGQSVKFGSATLCGGPASGNTESEAWLAVGDDDPLQLIFADQPRPDARQTLKALKAMGVTTELLTGDKSAIAEKTATALGIDKWTAEVTPRQKLDILNAHRDNGVFPLMVGDGINDAPAMAAAYASASPANAADVSRAASDIILQGDKLSGLPVAITTARKAERRVVENLSLAVIYNLIAVPLAVFGYVNPMIAALAMSGSSLLVTLNALRMAKVEGDKS